MIARLGQALARARAVSLAAKTPGVRSVAVPSTGAYALDVTRQQLIQLVHRIRDIDGESADVRDDLMDVFEANVPHPSARFLVFVPELVTFEDRQLSAEEVVDLALSYEPIPLGPPSDIANPPY